MSDNSGLREMLAHIASIRSATYNEEATGGLMSNYKFENYMSVQRVSRKSSRPLYPQNIPIPELPQSGGGGGGGGGT